MPLFNSHDRFISLARRQNGKDVVSRCFELVNDTEMIWKPQDWIEHASFGLGRVSENRGDRLDIDFINSGAKTILKTADLKPAKPPGPDFKLPGVKAKVRSGQFKVKRVLADLS